MTYWDQILKFRSQWEGGRERARGLGHGKWGKQRRDETIDEWKVNKYSARVLSWFGHHEFVSFFGLRCVSDSNLVCARSSAQQPLVVDHVIRAFVGLSHPRATYDVLHFVDVSLLCSMKLAAAVTSRQHDAFSPGACSLEVGLPHILVSHLHFEHLIHQPHRAGMRDTLLRKNERTQKHTRTPGGRVFFGRPETWRGKVYEVTNIKRCLGFAVLSFLYTTLQMSRKQSEKTRKSCGTRISDPRNYHIRSTF